MQRRISEYIQNHAERFLFFVWLLGMLIVAGSAYLGSTDEAEKSAWVQSGAIALDTIGGALLAGVLVGILVDHITRHKLSRETGEEWLWALLGEDTPRQLRERAKEVISHGQAHLSVEVRCELDWVEAEEDIQGRTRKALRTRIRVLTDGINHSRSEPYLPDGPAWAMTSVEGFETRYRKWVFEVGDLHGAKALRRLEADDGALRAHSHNRPPNKDDFEPDGSIFLYQRDLIDELSKDMERIDRAAGPRERFRLERELEIFLDPTDFFPFFVLVPTVKLKFRFDGDACPDLAIKARAGGTQLEQQTGDSGVKVFEPGAALLPGHVVILSWHPREAEEEAEAELGSKDELRSATA
ncbi:MAG: hypothetical protein ACJ76D_01895 [Solirubrobacterales bacterium]